MLDEGGIRLMIQLISNIHVYQTGEWPHDFTEFTVIDLKKPKLQNAATIKHDQPHRTYNQDSSKDKQNKDKIKTEAVLGVCLDLEEEYEIRMQLGC